MPRDQIPREGPSSDFSSIGPSQSASQISYQLPDPVPNTDPEILSQPTNDKGVVPTMPRPHSVASTTASSLYYTPVTPATYKVESINYAPAISVVVPASLPSSPMEINTPLALNPLFDPGLPPPIAYASESEAHTTMYIPAAHAIDEYEIPTAKAAETGSGSGGSVSGRTLTSWRHSRGESREELVYSSPQPQRTSLGASAVPGSTSGPNAILSNTSSSTSTSTVNRGGGVGGAQTAVPTRVVGSALIEVFDDPVEEEEEEEDDSELPVEVEDQLIKQGKLAVVENPRFMSEEKRKEVEREQTKLLGGAEKDHKSTESEPGKKSFPFLQQQHKRTSTQDVGHVTFAPVSSAPSTPKNSPSKAKQNLPNSSPTTKTSPSKRFFGSLKGLFVGARPPEVPSSPQVRDSSSPSRFRDRSSSPSRIPAVDLNADSDSDEYPIKTRSGFQAFLRGTGAKKKDGSSAAGGTRWSTRTDKNIRKLTKSGGGDDDDDEYDMYLSQDVRNGVAGDIVVKAGLVGGGGGGSRAVRKRTASEIGTSPPGGSSAVTGGGGGRKKLKKTLPPPVAAAAPAPASALQNTSSTQRNDTAPATTTTTTNDVHAPKPNPSSTVLKELSVKTGVPKKRSASVDESATGRTTVGVGGVGQTPAGGGSGKEEIVDLGKRRRVSSVIPSMTPARGIPAATTRTPATGMSAASKGYSSDTAASAAPPTVTPAAATTNTPSRPTLTRQPSIGKTQTHPTSNPPVENTGGSSRQPHIHPQQPQPHRQHSASSSGGGAIVLTAGATQPTGTLISQPGWNAQAMPTAGGGLSRNNSILSGVSGAAGGSSSGGAGGGGMSKKKKQRQTMLGHGMGSGTSIGRRSSLGSSSGHGGGAGGVVQPTQPPAQSLMSIVEDVAKHNREWSQESSQLLKNRNKIVSSGLEKDKKGPVVGMVDVVKAPRRVGRDELAQLDPARIKARVMETSTTTTTNLPPAPAATGGRGRLVDIKAPGSIFDQRDTAIVGSTSAVQQKVYRQASNSTPDLTQTQQVNVARRASVTASGPAATSTPAARSKRPAKSPLRSAMKNLSRTPSPLTSPFLEPHLQKQQQARQEGSRHAAVKSNVGGVVAPVPVAPAQYSAILGSQQPLSQTQSTAAATDIRPTATMANGRDSYDSTSQRRKGKRQFKKGASDEVGEEAGDSTSGNEIFYTDDEADDDHRGEAVATESRAPPMLNGHAVGYTGSSDLSHSTTSTAAVVHRLPPTTTSSTSQPTTTLVARRRKSVRVSLQPTFSPSPPAVESDDDKEEQPWEWEQDHRHHTTEGGGGQQLHVHAPVPVAAGTSLLLNPAHRQKVEAPEPSAHAVDIWEDSDEDVEYQKAKLLLTRAARKEKDMNVFAARSRS